MCVLQSQQAKQTKPLRVLEINTWRVVSVAKMEAESVVLVMQNDKRGKRMFIEPWRKKKTSVICKVL